MTWWSVDPGQVHVGVAIWDKNMLVAAFETSPEAFAKHLQAAVLPFVVIEAFTLSGSHYSRAKATQAEDTLKLIGFVQFSSDFLNFHVYEQQPAVRHVAQRSPFWTQLIKEFPMGGNSHVRSAVSHGVYFLNFTEAGRRLRDSWEA